MSVTSDRIRREFKAADDKRDAGLTTPQGIVRYDNIAYGRQKEQLLDLYRPRAMEGQTLPVIVNVHGGGWVYGDKERYQYYCMQLALQGFAVVNFTYRLAPENKFPAQLEDVNLAFHWVFDNASLYRLDTKNIFGVGDSAGAHLLGLYTCICTNSDYADRFEFHAPSGFVPRAVALNCGVYEIDAKEAGETNSLMADLLPEGGTLDEISGICVTGFVNSKFSPVYMMTATGDFARQFAPPMITALMEHDVPFEFHQYGDSRKLLTHVFHCDIRSESAIQCNLDECRFFRANMDNS